MSTWDFARNRLKGLSIALALGALLAASAALAGAVNPKVLSALESKSRRVRIAAVVAISKSDDPLARRYLQGMLGDREPTVRAAAADGLGKLGDRKALRALQLVLKEDKSALVRKMVKRAIASIESSSKKSAQASSGAGTVVLDVSDVRNLSGRKVAGAEALLARLVREKIAQSKKRSWRFVDGASEGYGLLLTIKKIQNGKQGDISTVKTRCELTLVQLPNRSLRLASSATATAGIEGALDAELEAELATDGIKSCAPALADDVLGYLLSRP